MVQETAIGRSRVTIYYINSSSITMSFAGSRIKLSQANQEFGPWYKIPI
jgi:hypothetical protein